MTDAEAVEPIAVWAYRGIWGVLTQWFRVPAGPPEMPADHVQRVQSLRPAVGFLRYAKFQLWLVLGVLALSSFGVTVALLVAVPVVGLVAGVLTILGLTILGVVSYLAIHLRFDTTWYVLTDRSLRIRRGIWVIHEATITFENIQNVSVEQGPLQRFFGIANVNVDTAGGGSGAGAHAGAGSVGHHGLIEGVDNAEQVRDLVMSRLQHSRSAGLGDEHSSEQHADESSFRLSREHLAVLREIRDAAAMLASSAH